MNPLTGAPQAVEKLRALGLDEEAEAVEGLLELYSDLYLEYNQLLTDCAQPPYDIPAKYFGQ